jgi:hypothetical protein
MLFITMKHRRPVARRDHGVAGALPVPAVMHVLRSATRSLTYAHEHDIVHRGCESGQHPIEKDGTH